MHKHDNTTEEEVFEELLDEAAATTTQDEFLAKFPCIMGFKIKCFHLDLGR